jgi:hypothetical protein
MMHRYKSNVGDALTIITLLLQASDERASALFAMVQPNKNPTFRSKFGN